MSEIRPYTVSYNSENSWSVVTQTWGSIWPKVLPYCFANVLLMVFLLTISKSYTGSRNCYFCISAQSHTFVTLVISFLLVSRVQLALSRYWTARNALSIMFRTSREIVHSACIFSPQTSTATLPSPSLSSSSCRSQSSSRITNNKDQDRYPAIVIDALREWRIEVAYQTLLLLKMVMVVIDFPVRKRPAWQVEALDQGPERRDLEKHIFRFEYERLSRMPEAHWPKSAILTPSEQCIWQETMRVPIRLAYLLQQTVRSQESRFLNGELRPIPACFESRIHASIDTFMKGYFCMRTFLTTPVPFPLVQMTKIILFVYVFTIPFVLLGEKEESGSLADVVAIFVMTYGFVGLEIVAIELDNPFGEDENDYDHNALALTTYEDTYMTICEVVGDEAAIALRKRMQDGIPENSKIGLAGSELNRVSNTLLLAPVNETVKRISKMSRDLCIRLEESSRQKKDYALATAGNKDETERLCYPPSVFPYFKSVDMQKENNSVMTEPSSQGFAVAFKDHVVNDHSSHTSSSSLSSMEEH